MAAVYLSPNAKLANSMKDDPPSYNYYETGFSPPTSTSPSAHGPTSQNTEPPLVKSSAESSCRVFLFVVVSLVIGCAVGCIITYIGMERTRCKCINEAPDHGILVTTEPLPTEEAANVIEDHRNTTEATTETPCTKGSPLGCPPFWTRFQDNCYRFFGQSTIWLDAEAQCNSYFTDAYQGHLVSIHSKAESDFVFKLWQDSLIQSSQIDSSVLRPNPNGYGSFDCIFIGLNDMQEEGVYVWTDGTPKDYNEWGPSSPSDGGIGGTEDCTNWIHPARPLSYVPWNDIPCSANLLMPYVCKLRL